MQGSTFSLAFVDITLAFASPYQASKPMNPDRVRGLIKLAPRHGTHCIIKPPRRTTTFAIFSTLPLMLHLSNPRSKLLGTCIKGVLDNLRSLGGRPRGLSMISATSDFG